MSCLFVAHLFILVSGYSCVAAEASRVAWFRGDDTQLYDSAEPLNPAPQDNSSKSLRYFVICIWGNDTDNDTEVVFLH